MTDLDLLRMEHISKAFPGVQALDDVSLNVGAGEILGLIGENGAGKSTLMKIVSGVYPADQGQIFLRGQPVQIQNPHHAQQLGLAIIYQEFNLMPNLTVMENIFVGREPGRFAFVDRRRLEKQAQELLDRLGVRLSPDRHRARPGRRRTADGRDRQGALHEGAGHHHGRADLGPERDRGSGALSHHARSRNSTASASSSSRTGSKRCARSATGSRCCATAKMSARWTSPTRPRTP